MHQERYGKSFLNLLTPEACRRRTCVRARGYSRSREGHFARDGQSLFFLIGGLGEARGRVLKLARADGSGVRTLAERTSFFRLAGRWLYYTDETDTGFSFYRVDRPDGAPQLLDTYSGSYDTYEAVCATTSPDG
jgi:hypothetical protein